MSSRTSATPTILFALLAATLLVGTTCGKRINNGPSLSDYLPGQTASGLQCSSEVRKYNRETLWEYLDGGADLYLDHGFTHMASADYRVRDLEFTADVYAFESTESATRLYTIIRPPDVLRDVRIGQEGYLDPGMLVFVHGSCLVRITGSIDTPESQKLLADLAEAVARRMQVQQDGTSE